jgi:tetratricopeptide (TPR) repeat protein
MKTWLILIGAMLALGACRQNPKDEQAGKNPAHIQLVEELSQKVRQSPDSSPVRMRLVDALDSLGNYPQAMLQLDTLIMHDSLNNGLWYRKAQLYEVVKDTTAAIRSYERALHIYQSIEAQLSLANLLAEKKDSRSLAICNSILKMGVDRETSADCYFIMGVFYARTNDATNAIAMFDACINNSYTYMEAYMEKGFALYDAKKLPEAEKVFDRAITVNNMYADAYYWKAKTEEAMGNKQDAIINYQRSLGLDKNLKEANEALKRLQ